MFSSSVASDVATYVINLYISTYIHSLSYHIAEKFGGENDKFTLFKCLAGQMNRSAKGLLTVIITLNGFSLVNLR